MKTHVYLTTALICASLLATKSITASAEESVVVETIMVSTYVNGGIGKNEEEIMRRVAKEFPLRLTFSERKNGEYIADVPVVIVDANSNPVFELSKAGPLLDVVLPNGKYKVSARFKGKIETQEVTLTGKDGKDLYFHWK